LVFIALALDLEADEFRTHRHDVADLAAQRHDAPLHRGRHLDGGLVGHDVGQDLILDDGIARLDVPFDQFDFRDAFADVRHLDDVNAHYASRNTRLNASATRLGPGKSAHSCEWGYGVSHPVMRSIGASR